LQLTSTLIVRKQVEWNLIRVAVSLRACRAIKATLPAGSTVYPPERNAGGQYLIWLNEAEVNRLAALRRYGESYSEAALLMANEAAKQQLPKKSAPRELRVRRGSLGILKASCARSLAVG
jgi:hypothetical protein